MLAAIKKLICRFTPLIEFCHVCGRRVDQVWEADDALWLRLVGTSRGIRCIRCFDKAADARHIILLWVPTIMHDRGN